MIMQSEEKTIYTPEEYLEFETHSEERHEYINSKIVLMIGGTQNHNQINGNFYAALNLHSSVSPMTLNTTIKRTTITGHLLSMMMLMKQ
jgi:Uma2 family endonuclease